MKEAEEVINQIQELSDRYEEVKEKGILESFFPGEEESPKRLKSKIYEREKDFKEIEGEFLEETVNEIGGENFREDGGMYWFDVGERSVKMKTFSHAAGNPHYVVGGWVYDNTDFLGHDISLPQAIISKPGKKIQHKINNTDASKLDRICEEYKERINEVASSKGVEIEVGSTPEEIIKAAEDLNEGCDRPNAVHYKLRSDFDKEGIKRVVKYLSDLTENIHKKESPVKERIYAE